MSAAKKIHLHKLWKPSFPESMTAVQACELAAEHWKRMAKDPAAAKKRGERPGTRTCALCVHAKQIAGPILPRLACSTCLVLAYEHSQGRDLNWLCSDMYSHANEAFLSRMAGWEKVFRAAAKPIIGRLQLMVEWAKTLEKES